MSDGMVIVIIFAVIALMGGGLAAAIVLCIKWSRTRKERSYTGETMGVVERIRPGGSDRASYAYVRYCVDGVEYTLRESLKLNSALIKLGPIPIGQRKTYVLGCSVGSTVRVSYLPSDPSRAILTDNRGIMNV